VSFEPLFTIYQFDIGRFATAALSGADVIFLQRANKMVFRGGVNVSSQFVISGSTFKFLAIFVAGVASGNKSMYAISCGEGVRVACDIFELWTGKFAVAHDSIKN